MFFLRTLAIFVLLLIPAVAQGQSSEAQRLRTEAAETVNKLNSELNELESNKETIAQSSMAEKDKLDAIARQQQLIEDKKKEILAARESAANINPNAQTTQQNKAQALANNTVNTQQKTLAEAYNAAEASWQQAKTKYEEAIRSGAATQQVNLLSSALREEEAKLLEARRTYNAFNATLPPEQQKQPAQVTSTNNTSTTATGGAGTGAGGTGTGGGATALTPVNPDDIFKSAIEVGESMTAPGQKILYGLAILSILGVGAMALFGNFPISWGFGIVGGLVVMALSAGFADWILSIAEDRKDSSDSFEGISETLYQSTMIIKEDVSELLYILSGLAIVAIATAGFFGALSWKRVGALIAGLVVIAGAADIVAWIVTVEGV